MLVRVADEAWVGLATLHKKHPKRESFTPREILEQVRHLNLAGEFRPGVQVHVYLHNVGNIEPNPAKYRMFYRLPDGTHRLFRPGDTAHPDRRGKITPNREDLPEEYRSLLDWYRHRYSKRSVQEADDPVLQMRGLGKEIWSDTSADEYIRSLWAGWDEEGE